MNFMDLLLRAKSGEDFAVMRIVEMYQPLLIKESIVNGTYDEDLYQELCLILLNCIRKINI
jgi:hypothetical protein